MEERIEDWMKELLKLIRGGSFTSAELDSIIPKDIERDARMEFWVELIEMEDALVKRCNHLFDTILHNKDDRKAILLLYRRQEALNEALNKAEALARTRGKTLEEVLEGFRWR